MLTVSYCALWACLKIPFQVLGSFEACGLTAADRPIITHCQVLGDDLIEKMKTMGRVTTMSSWLPNAWNFVPDVINRVVINRVVYC